MVRQLATSHDIILVEGFKTVAFPHKVWLRRTADDRPPPEVGDVALDLKPGSQRESAVTAILEDVLKAASRSTPVYAGILIGGRSERMGRPKHLLRSDGRTWLERTVEVMQPQVEEVVLLGSGRVPTSLKPLVVLQDSKEGGGPLAGMLAAMRWEPGASWVFLACDLPLISRPAVKWLLAARAPGVWAVLPKTSDGIEPLLAWYDFRARPLLESCTGPCQMARSAKVLTPSPPRRLAGAWLNGNTPKDLVTMDPLSSLVHPLPAARQYTIRPLGQSIQWRGNAELTLRHNKTLAQHQ